ncbi:MAG: cupin domain-containing protein, partial [Methylocella sp.]
MTNLNSSAPHIHEASHYSDLVDWGPQVDALSHPNGAKSHSSGRLIWKSPERQSEAGLWVCTPGRWRLAVPRDEFLWVLAGKATYIGDAGDEVTLGPRDGVLFPAGWQGEATVHKTLRASYILSASELMESTPQV